MTYPAYGAPTQTDPYRQQQAPIYGDTATGGRMTIDTVVQKTGMTLGLAMLDRRGGLVPHPAAGLADAGVALPAG